MKPVARFGIAAVLILYVVCGFAVVSPLLTLLLNNTLVGAIGLLFVMMFATLALLVANSLPATWAGIFDLLNAEERPKWWLRLHVIFSYVTGPALLGIALVCSFVPLYSLTLRDIFASVFFLTGVAVFFAVISLWCGHRLIGMGYNWFCKAGFLGIESFSASAYQSFEQENARGLDHLLVALLTFQTHLKQNQLENEELSKTIRTLRCFLLFKSEIPFADLRELAFAAERLPSIESFGAALQKFNAIKGVQWSTSYKAVERGKRAPVEWILAVAAILAALTFIPESTRSLILGYLSQWSLANILFLIGFAFFFATSILSVVDSEYRCNPLRSFIQSRMRKPKKVIEGKNPTNLKG